MGFRDPLIGDEDIPDVIEGKTILGSTFETVVDATEAVRIRLIERFIRWLGPGPASETVVAEIRSTAAGQLSLVALGYQGVRVDGPNQEVEIAGKLKLPDGDPLVGMQAGISTDALNASGVGTADHQLQGTPDAIIVSMGVGTNSADRTVRVIARGVSDFDYEVRIASTGALAPSGQTPTVHWLAFMY